MDKREFLDRLQMQLRDLTSEERREAMEYYEEYFADAGEENEADVLLSLGSPEETAEQIKAGLRKADEGMFTENGYRERAESGNPPKVYGEKRADGSGRGQAETKRESHAGGEGAYNGYAQSAGKKKNNMSGGTLILIIILGILASPVIIGLGAAVFGIIAGLIGTVFGLVLALFFIVVALLVLGIGLFIGGFPLLPLNPFGGVLCIAAGCFLMALFLVCTTVIVLIFSRFFPWLIREVESFGKYLSRKWSERKRKGETA